MPRTFAPHRTTVVLFAWRVTYFDNCLWVLYSPCESASPVPRLRYSRRHRRRSPSRGRYFSRSPSLFAGEVTLQSCLILYAPIGEICCLSASLLPRPDVTPGPVVCGARKRCPNPADRRKPQKRNTQMTKSKSDC